MNELNNKIREIFELLINLYRKDWDVDKGELDIDEATQAIADLITEQVRLGRIDELESLFNDEYFEDKKVGEVASFEVFDCINKRLEELKEL